MASSTSTSPATPTPATSRFKVAADTLVLALRQQWTVADTADVLAMLGLEQVAVDLGWRPAEDVA